MITQKCDQYTGKSSGKSFVLQQINTHCKIKMLMQKANRQKPPHKYIFYKVDTKCQCGNFLYPYYLRMKERIPWKILGNKILTVLKILLLKLQG